MPHGIRRNEPLEGSIQHKARKHFVLQQQQLNWDDHPPLFPASMLARHAYFSASSVIPRTLRGKIVFAFLAGKSCFEPIVARRNGVNETE